MSAWYSEKDKNAAAWLRELIKAGLIAPGEVDERDLWDVRPEELTRFTQCHFFAGIGVWSYALRQAGWPDSRPVWTGSCPCQPFSSAGKGIGFADERHLWPAFLHHIRLGRPRVLFGEQVTNGDGETWLDLVQADLEGEGYRFAPIDLCAAGFGAPHIRQRLFFVADTSSERLEGCRNEHSESQRHIEVCGNASSSMADTSSHGHVAADGIRAAIESSIAPRENGIGEPAGSGNASDCMADSESARRGIRNAYDLRASDGEVNAPGDDNEAGELADTGRSRRERDRPEQIRRGRTNSRTNQRTPRSSAAGVVGDTQGRGLRERRDETQPRHGGHADSAKFTNGFWANAEWLYCRDNKYRAVEPGTFPLAHGAPARVGRLRGYGNAIVAPVAQAFIEAYLEERVSA